ncbi:glucosamine-6-phosphate deaminase [Anaerocolumna aminovalerica]|jgi:glucosamine-6-phosphate deaminase|uniref:Glucosamine-6-phosphate deaminase n=1 Tax=Anaerocolumna aminovalerica TaxID=1527 RepID=A0A1I5DYZ7_9FIRM|nr:glucosamine-6-phosphate deaminase [Anaerocolumna aminovalerica]MDU6263451.1 glucosamine-6-phosphate deaminase [Anaerocolumna aminovalerica]SFO04422.1 glucosamine-6-phosphate deaminase [Anaerocolumna aminovalerica]
MNIKILKDSIELGQEAAKYSAHIINRAITEKGKARIILSTGASQFDTLKALIESDIDWSKVEMFHLDEYINLPISHPASFRKYLKERFIDKINLKSAYLVNGEGDIKQTIEELTKEIRKEPIDLGLIGIGENAHIAFNDPPADFGTEDAYIVVNLDEACKQQQVSEGWFPSVKEVPDQAISMSVYQIMQCKNIVSSVPFKVKANAIKNMMENPVSQRIPATILKMHNSMALFLDKDSAFYL